MIKSLLNSIKRVVPLAQRTSRLVQEKWGTSKQDDISQLPSEYIELANKCNNIEQLYKNVLKITTNYENESYDYPTNVQESFTKLVRTSLLEFPM